MASLNKVCLIGNLGADPEIRTLPSGGKVVNLSIATSDRWKDKSTGEQREKTEWHRVVIFQEGLVRVVESYLKKGSKVYLEGSLQTRKWQDQSGADKYSTEIVLQGFNSQLVMLDGKGDGGSGGGGQQQPVQQQSSARPGAERSGQGGGYGGGASADPDEIPFAAIF